MDPWIDLHCHWVFGIDDGAKTVDDSRAILSGLKGLGFSKVVATPHMRPGMFNNTKEDLQRAYEATVAALGPTGDLPELLLSSEHFFDDVVFQRLQDGEGIPYPGERAVLLEFAYDFFPQGIASRFFELRRKRLRPVLAHPERYEPLWRDPDRLSPMINAGTVCLLDVAALIGKYGKNAKKCAEILLERQAYYAACTDTHKPSDIEDMRVAIARLKELVGDDEVQFLFGEGPQRILSGEVLD